MGIARTHQTGPGTPGSPEVPFQAAVPEVPFQAAIPPVPAIPAIPEVPAMPRMTANTGILLSTSAYAQLPFPQDTTMTLANAIPIDTETEDIISFELTIIGFPGPHAFTTDSPSGTGTGTGIFTTANRVSLVDVSGTLFLGINFDTPGVANNIVSVLSGTVEHTITINHVTAEATALIPEVPGVPGVPGVPEVPFQAAIPEVPFQAAVPANPSHLPTLDAGEGGVVIAIVSTETGLNANQEQTDPLTYTIGSGASLTTLPLRVGSLLPGNAVVSSVELETFHIIVDS